MRLIGRDGGFSLIEMAMVLMLMGLLLGGLAVPLGRSVDQMRRSDTQRQLQEIHDALLGFAAARGRLPCPANAGGAVPALCASLPANHGFLPARELGVRGPVDPQGRLLDAWGNPFRYSVTISDGGAFTATDVTRQMRAVGISALAPRLFICSAAAGCGWTSAKLHSLPAIYFSTGRDPAPASPEELENLDGDDGFVERAYNEAAGSEFDHLVGWISPNVLYTQMIAAGQLP